MADQLKPGLHETIPDMSKWDTKRWPNFQIMEFVCGCNGKHCSNEYYHDPEFLDKLQAMRKTVGKSFRINSGHRCRDHNTAIGGAAKSRHLDIAADISLFGHDRMTLFNTARAVGFRGIGLGETFIHVDIRDTLTLWDYGAKSRKLWGVSYSPWELVPQS